MESSRTSTGFFGEQATRWAELYSTKKEFSDRIALFTGFLAGHVPAPADVLDFGCGTGDIAVQLARAGYQVKAVDGSAGMIEVARRSAADCDEVQVDFGVCPAESLELQAASLDAIVCSSVLEYIEDDLGLLLRFAYGLRPGGVLLISIPDRLGLKGLAEDLLKCVPGYCQSPSRRHLLYSRHRYHRRNFRRLARQAGFEAIGFRRFENPIPGRLGIWASRLPFLGTMLFAVLRKNPQSVTHICRSSRSLLACLGPRYEMWDAAPDQLKVVVGGLLRKLPAETLLGGRFAKTHQLCEQSQRWNSRQIEAYQLEQLRGICTLAAEFSPLYQRVFEQSRFNPLQMTTLNAFRNLPTIDRNTIREFSAEIIARTGERGVAVSTGGTSGEPIHFRMSAHRSAVEYAHLVSSWRRVGFKPGMPMAVLRGRVVRPDRKGLYHEYDPILRYHYYSAFHMTDENMRRYLKHIASIGPCFLHVYPSSVAALARFVRRSGMSPPASIRGIIAESEIVYPEQRALVEEVFGCRYFSCYGHTEKLVLAAECEHSTDYHVWPTYGYFELLDERGQPATTPGQRGEIVGTGFINTVMPFIRYRTGDYATYLADRCEACGRQHTIIRDIRGHRTQEMLVAADGSEISWTALNMHDDTFARVRQFQFYQDTPGRAVLRIVPANGFDDEGRQRIHRNLGCKLDGRLDFTIERVDSIPLTVRGKAIYVDQQITTGATDAHVLNRVADIDRS